MIFDDDGNSKDRLDDVIVSQPVLHNVKGAGSRAMNVIGQVLLHPHKVPLLPLVGNVAKRYKQGSMPINYLLF